MQVVEGRHLLIGSWESGTFPEGGKPSQRGTEEKGPSILDRPPLCFSGFSSKSPWSYDLICLPCQGLRMALYKGETEAWDGQEISKAEGRAQTNTILVRGDTLPTNPCSPHPKHTPQRISGVTLAQDQGLPDHFQQGHPKIVSGRLWLCP